MKGCRFKFIGGMVKCSDREGCLILENDQVERGDLSKVSDLNTETLVRYTGLFGRGGYYRRRCKCSENIATEARKALRER